MDILGNPAMHERDVSYGIEGDDIHITSFGICKSEQEPDTDIITLENEKPRDEYGDFTGTPAKGTITGRQCKPIIVSRWQNPAENLV